MEMMERLQRENIAVSASYGDQLGTGAIVSYSRVLMSVNSIINIRS
jgi:hypothetical protein